jgi:iron complex outermembrane receptor protein
VCNIVINFATYLEKLVMKKFYGLLVLRFVSFTTLAQEVNGKVKDADGKLLQNATVSLLKEKDSSVVKLSVTNEKGQFVFESIANGKYLISASFVGYNISYSKSFELANNIINVSDIQLQKAASTMQAVVVSSKKPMIEVKADKTILNVEGTINAAGQDALELLRKSPGVLVDKDDNISLSGKNGVQVYIDGRPSPLSGKNLSDYLKTLQSSQIEAIEIITNPSAKYDAAGNAGIINLKLKKDKTIGTNGSVTTGINFGIFPKYNGNISLNNRNKKANVFGNYSYNKSRNEMFVNFRRELLDSLFLQKGLILSNNNSHNIKVGTDLFLTKKSTLGFIVTGNISDNDMTNNSTTPISYVPSGVVNRVLVAENATTMSNNNFNFNGNYRLVNSNGSEFNIDADYGFFKLNSDQLQPNYYYNAGGNVELNRYVYNMIAPSNINIYTLKTDYEQNYKGGKLGFGGKFSYVKTDNDFQRYNVFTSSKKLDTLRSNQFAYTENINAAYVNYNKAYKGFMFQFGLRLENTNAEGKSNGYKQTSGGSYVTYDSTFTRNYTNLFPSAAITFNKNPMNQWGLSYSRRIDRPAYQDLNPFEFKLDEYTFQKGNTQLTPQYTNSFSLTNTYKYRLTSTLNYSHVKDVFTQLIDTAEKSKSFITKKNLAIQDIVSLNISYPFQYKWYSAFANLNTYYSHYKANFGVGRTIDLDVFAYNFYMQNSFQLGKGWTGELSGWYASPSIWQGTFESNAMWSVEGGVQKQLFNGRGNLKVSVSDIFQTMRWKGTSNFAGQLMIANGGWESRLLKLNFTWRFGSNQIKSARQRKTGLEEESKRVQQGGGGIVNN